MTRIFSKIFLILLSSSSSLVFADQEKILLAKVPHGSIVIDGKDDDQGWTLSGVNLLPYSIIDGTTAKITTHFQIAYDEESLYIRFFSPDPDMDSLRKKFDRRDAFVNSDDDRVAISIDPNGDGKLSQFFGVTADCAIYDGINNIMTGFSDLAPNFNVDAACSQGPDSWLVEMVIPFSELKYRKSPTLMTVLVQRKMLRDFDALFASENFDPSTTCNICSARQIEVDTPPKVTKTKAVVEGFYGESSVDGLSRIRRDAGVTLGVPIGEGTFVDLTFHPDYSQVDADQPYLSANILYPQLTVENRPFFLEGGDIIFAPYTAATSRAIVAPEYGAKILSRSEDYNFIAIAARDSEKTYRLAPGTYWPEMVQARGKSDNLIARGTFNAGKNLSLGLSANAKDEVGLHKNAVIGPDFSLKLDEKHRVYGQNLFSRTKDEAATVFDGTEDIVLEQSTKNGSASTLGYEYSGDNRFFGVNVGRIGQNFSNDLGFMPDNGVKTADVTGQLSFPLRNESLHLAEFVIRSGVWQRFDDSSNRLVSFTSDVTMDFISDSWVTLSLSLTPTSRLRIDADEDLHHEHGRKVILSARPPKYVSLLECSYADGARLVYSEDRIGQRQLNSCLIRLSLGQHLSAQFSRDVDTYRILENGHLLREQLSSAVVQYFFDSTNSIRVTGQDRKTETYEGTDTSVLWTALMGHQPARGLSLFVGGSRAKSSYDEKDGIREYFVKTSYSL